MNSPVGWALPILAGAASAIAVVAGSNLAVAVPAATVAVLAAGAILGGAWIDRTATGLRSSPEGVPTAPDRIRTAFRSGPLGRAEIVGLLDQLERSGPRPDLPTRTGAELDRITALRADEFERYVRSRVDALEAET